ncbi:hypothetical protein HGM15179_016863, partial [Zosterops borbonicus]
SLFLPGTPGQHQEMFPISFPAQTPLENPLSCSQVPRKTCFEEEPRTSRSTFPIPGAIPGIRNAQ